MSAIPRRLPAWPILFATLSFASCKDTVWPERDATPPVADLRLSVWKADDVCPCIAVFAVNPVGSSDNVTERDALQVRWDFDNDGIWDTDYRALDMLAYDPDPLPVDTWTVRCEVRDLAGNTAVAVASMTLPAWLPVPDDLVAGAVRVYKNDVGCVCGPVDTLLVGQGFSVTAYRQDWLTPSGLPLTSALVLDGVQVSEAASTTIMPDRFSCGQFRATVAAGFATAGVHEIKVVVDTHDDIAETDETNNVSVREIVVIER